MPTKEKNLKEWNEDYAWSEGGDEWSYVWGGTEGLWWWVLFPRIRNFLKVNTMLEIAPGHGRIARYLKNYCDKLQLVDLSPNCIEACKKKFANETKIEYFVNDGYSLEMLKDDSIDFVFSFDALVHVEKDVMESYVKYLGKKLSKNGVGFIQHSNVGAFPKIGDYAFSARPPFAVRKQWRGRTMSAELFREYCENSGIHVISQELINWGSSHLNDSFSLFTKKGSIYEKPTVIVENYDFMKNAEMIAKVSNNYNVD